MGIELTVRVFGWAVALGLVGVSGSAIAQSHVSVRVLDSAGRPMDAAVTFRGRDGGVHQCRTVVGRCGLQVPAGSYELTMVPVRQHAPLPRRVSIGYGDAPLFTLRSVPRPPARLNRTTVRAAAHPSGGTRRTSTPSRAAVQRRVTRPATRATRSTTQTMASDAPSNSTVPTAATPTAATPRRAAVTAPTTRRAMRRTPVVSRAATRPSMVVQRPATRVARTRVAGMRTQRTSVVVASMGIAATSVPIRDLGQGQSLRVQGTIVDAQGRPADARLTIRRAGRTLGEVRSVAGQFSVFDVEPGVYEVAARSVRTGRTTTRQLTVGTGLAQPRIRLQ